MKTKRPNITKREAVVIEPGRLLITRIPRVGLVEVQAAIDDTIYWQQHQPTTREDRIARDEALVRLLQVRWHVRDALLGKAVVAQDEAA